MPVELEIAYTEFAKGAYNHQLLSSKMSGALTISWTRFDVSLKFATCLYGELKTFVTFPTIILVV